MYEYIFKNLMDDESKTVHKLRMKWKKLPRLNLNKSKDAVLGMARAYKIGELMPRRKSAKGAKLMLEIYANDFETRHLRKICAAFRMGQENERMKEYG